MVEFDYGDARRKTVAKDYPQHGYRELACGDHHNGYYCTRPVGHKEQRVAPYRPERGVRGVGGG